MPSRRTRARWAASSSQDALNRLALSCTWARNPSAPVIASNFTAFMAATIAGTPDKWGRGARSRGASPADPEREGDGGALPLEGREPPALELAQQTAVELAVPVPRLVDPQA